VHGEKIARQQTAPRKGGDLAGRFGVHPLGEMDRERRARHGRRQLSAEAERVR